jgi:hypothetical protein
MADIKTARQELEEVQQALSNVALGGQSYQIGSRKLTRAEYSQLLARQKELQAEIAAESNTSLIDDTYVAFFEGR